MENDEGFVLNADGTVDVRLNGESPLRLSSPKIGQYRMLRGQIIALLDRQRELLEELQNREDRRTTVNEDELLDRIEADQLSVLQSIFETLGEGEIPPQDEWPAWTLNRTLLSRMSVHWREVPLVRGPRERSTVSNLPSAGIGTLPPLGPE